MLEIKTDDRICHLVETLNTLDGIRTFSSCGGHENPGLGQIPAGEFDINMDVEPTEAGFYSLSIIRSAMYMHPEHESLMLQVWLCGVEPDVIAFSLWGCNKADPGILSELILNTALRHGREF